ncbi:MAG TPA: hypothetical protein VLC12_02650, partial [Terriglobales bacterium]|nr:hypothetical protein [Terriglobales bacterium]
MASQSARRLGGRSSAEVPVLVLMVKVVVTPLDTAGAVAGEKVQLAPAGKFPQEKEKSCPTAAP